jgi:hypothetical protein
MKWSGCQQVKAVVVEVKVRDLNQATNIFNYEQVKAEAVAIKKP